ncbi:hypothetical protein ES703_37510 [subsurface metagenome]
MIATQPNILTWPRRISKSRIRVHLTIPGEPISKQRPRFSINKNGRVYTPRQTRESEEWIGWQIKNAYQGLMPDVDYAFGVRIMFYQSNQQRRDLDNMTKLILDACTRVVWEDDSQVTEIIAHVFRGDDKPRTELCIYSLDYIIHMTSTCLACGKQFGSERKRSTALVNVFTSIKQLNCNVRIVGAPSGAPGLSINREGNFAPRLAKLLFGENIKLSKLEVFA